MKRIDYYKILGVDKNTGPAEIKQAYRRLALKYHPDKLGGSEEKFSVIREAYETLSNPFKRKNYDSSRYNPLTRPRTHNRSYRPNPSLLRVYVNKRVVHPNDIVRVTFTLNGMGTILGINGLQNFIVLQGPIVTSGINDYNNHFSLFTRYTYLLKPIKTGYLDIGPANASVNGEVVSSSYLSIKVSHKTTPTQNRLARIKEMKLMSMAVALIFAAIVLTHLIFQPDTVPYDEMYANRQMSFTSYHTLTMERPSDFNQLQNGDSPYDNFFGEGKYDRRSFNMIRFINGEQSDAIIFLAKKQNDEVIRNEYIQAGTTHVMEHIPEGKYYMRMLTGVDWNPLKPANEGKVLGGFNRYYGSKIFDNSDNIFNMVQKDQGNYVEYSVYEITLFPIADGNMGATDVNHTQIFDR